MKAKLIVLFYSLFSITSLAAQMAQDPIEAKVIEVIDGNTLVAKDENGEEWKVMLAGIDSPELNQQFGNEAKSFLEAKALKKAVTITLQGKDRWGNRLAVVMLKGKDDLRVELLSKGLAWTSERNPIPELEKIRIEAENAKKGIWQEEQPTPPWIFRRQQTLMQEKGS
ncbi:MAG: thermonuclease family protein [Cyclobacteriaceae bacterium]|jgi:micrococcal nuclease|nr:thermonuclease family protein [Cyclobacteriaceae bacterium]